MSAAEHLPPVLADDDDLTESGELPSVDEVDAANPYTIDLLGRTLARGVSDSCWIAWNEGTRPFMQLTRHARHDDPSAFYWSFRVRGDVGKTGSSIDVSTQATNPEDAAQVWLLVASVEAPKLCALVCDGMPASRA
jgi:hypothetical protein